MKHISKILVVSVLFFGASAFAGTGVSLERFKNLMIQISKDSPELKEYEVVQVETTNKAYGSHGVNIIMMSPDQNKAVGLRYVFLNANTVPTKEEFTALLKK